MNKWDRIRAFYREHKEEILTAPAHQWGVDPYSWEEEAGVSMTPIESALWQDMRTIGAVLYPQYPVGRYFVDFGNPVAKVAIECDGAAYHTDKARDAARQRDIEALGWAVYRITGRACLTDYSECEDDHGRLVINAGEAMRFMRDIAQRYWLAARYLPEFA